jgi:hypothetical protein
LLGTIEHVLPCPTDVLLENFGHPILV